MAKGVPLVMRHARDSDRLEIASWGGGGGGGGGRVIVNGSRRDFENLKKNLNACGRGREGG